MDWAKEPYDKVCEIFASIVVVVISEHSLHVSDLPLDILLVEQELCDYFITDFNWVFEHLGPLADCCDIIRQMQAWLEVQLEMEDE